MDWIASNTLAHLARHWETLDRGVNCYVADSEVIHQKAGSEDALKTTAEAGLASAKATLALLRTDQKASNATLKAAQATVDFIEAEPQVC